MGWLTHIFEAEYYYPDETSLDDLKSAVEQAITTYPKKGEYTLVQGEEEVSKLFQRSGEEHSVKHAYRNDQVADEDKTVFVTHRTRLFGFVDDMAFTFGNLEDGKAYIKAFSISRVGKGDMKQNAKNVRQIMNRVKKDHPFEKEKVFKS